jgi:hypothetical protein
LEQPGIIDKEEERGKLEEIEPGLLYNQEKIGEWCQNSVAAVWQMRYAPRIYPHSIMVDMNIGDIWDNPGPLVMEVAADLILDRGVLRVLQKEFTEEALHKAFSQRKGPGEIIKFTTKTQSPGYMVMLITRNRRGDPTNEKWLRESLEKLEMFLIEHPQIREINCTELSLNNRRLRGPMLMRLMEQVVHLTGVIMRVWIAPTEPMSAIAMPHQINAVEEFKEKSLALVTKAEMSDQRWSRIGNEQVCKGMQEVIGYATTLQREIQATALTMALVVFVVIIALLAICVYT